MPHNPALIGTDYPAGMGSLDAILTQFCSIGIEDSLREHIMSVRTKVFFDEYRRPAPR
ncbi:MAG: hypothetical protein QNJ75_11390 [Acidimicrobiia bacterium]|nr:hypothetical protein [Acidimicrobiia bacterium]